MKCETNDCQVEKRGCKGCFYEDVENVEFLIRDLQAMGYNQTFINSLKNMVKKLKHVKNLNEHQSKDIKKAVNYTFELNKELEIAENINDLMADDLLDYYKTINKECSHTIDYKVPKTVEEVKELYKKMEEAERR